MQDTAFLSDIGGEFELYIYIALYFYFAFMQSKIAARIGHEYPFWAYIPILNFIQQIQLARKDVFWFILCLIPIINIIAFIFIWMDIARQCGKSPLWGLMATAPLLNIFAFGYLAYSDEESKPVRPMVISSYRENEPVG